MLLTIPLWTLLVIRFFILADVLDLALGDDEVSEDLADGPAKSKIKSNAREALKILLSVADGKDMMG